MTTLDIDGPALDDGDSVNGIPRSIARKAASEKLRTEVIEISVDAKHMFIDLSMSATGAVR